MFELIRIDWPVGTFFINKYFIVKIDVHKPQMPCITIELNLTKDLLVPGSGNHNPIFIQKVQFNYYIN